MNERTAISMILGLAVPGAGHAFLGKRARGAAFFAIVFLMFLTGILIDGKIYTLRAGQLLNNLATLASMGSGLLYIAARKFGVAGDIMSITFEHGTAFTLTAGLMNLLLVLDCWDISTGGKS